MEGFKFAENQEIYTSIEGEISKHRVRGFYTRPNGDKIYVIVTYGRESLLKETQVFGTLDEAKAEAIGYIEGKRDELNGKVLQVQELADMDATEERSPQELADIQKREEAEAKEIEETEGKAEAEPTDTPN